MAYCCPPGAVGYLAPDHKDEGVIKSVDGVSFYQIGSGKNGLMLLPDVWGWNSGRTRALADEFSKRGMSVYVPKILEPYQVTGEKGSESHDDGLPPDFNIKERFSELKPLLSGAWHREKATEQCLKVVKAMKSAGVERIGLHGFCYGAWPGMELAAKVPEVVCCSASHPSLHLEGMVGGDAVELASKSKAPWAFFPCGKADAGGDPDMYDEDGAAFKALEKNFPKKNLTKRIVDMAHGFHCRGHIRESEFNFGRGDDVQKAVAEITLDCLRWFRRHRLCRLNADELPPPKLRQPRWGKVTGVKPDGKGLNLLLKVVKSEDVAEAKNKTVDVIAGDKTGVVTLRLVDEDKIKTCADGASIRVQNARVLMVKGHVRVIVDKWGVLKPVETAHDFEVNKDKDVSATEYEKA
jgi:dienelactone hydrolase